MTTRTRLARDQRRSMIVAKAIQLANEKQSLTSATIRSVADQCGISHSGVRYHFRTNNDLWKAVLGIPARPGVGADPVIFRQAAELGLTV